MAERIRRLPFTNYHDALDGFTRGRKEINKCIEDNPEKFGEIFESYKQKALAGDVIAMDVLAYYYKSGVKNLLHENYNRYITWEMLAAGRGNELAIEKLQFLIGYACEAIMDSADYDTICYKNDIDDYNVLYVLGKAICKILVRDFLKAYVVDVVALKDNLDPYKKEYFISLRKMIDDVIPKTIEFLKS